MRKEKKFARWRAAYKGTTVLSYIRTYETLPYDLLDKRTVYFPPKCLQIYRTNPPSPSKMLVKIITHIIVYNSRCTTDECSLRHCLPPTKSSLTAPPPKKNPRKIPSPSFPSISEKISRRPNLDHHPIPPPPCRKFSYTIFLALVSILNLFSRFLSFFPRPFCSSSFIEDYNRLVFTERRRDPKEMVQRPRQDFVYYFCFIFVERVARSHTFFFHLLFIGIFSGTSYVR